MGLGEKWQGASWQGHVARYEARGGDKAVSSPCFFPPEHQAGHSSTPRPGVPCHHLEEAGLGQRWEPQCSPGYPEWAGQRCREPSARPYGAQGAGWRGHQVVLPSLSQGSERFSPRGDFAASGGRLSPSGAITGRGASRECPWQPWVEAEDAADGPAVPRTGKKGLLSPKWQCRG